MRKFFLSAAFFLLAAGCAGVDACPCAAPGGGATVTPILRADRNALGQPLAIPPGDVEVVVSRYEIRPGARLPVHKHPYQRYAYVLAGHLRVVCDGGHTGEFAPGDFLVESVDTWHYGENIGADPVVLLVIDHVPKGRANTVKKE